jgi:hypothetical protein
MSGLSDLRDRVLNLLAAATASAQQRGSRDSLCLLNVDTSRPLRAQRPAIRRRLGERVESTLYCPSRSVLRTGAKREKVVFGRRRGPCNLPAAREE